MAVVFAAHAVLGACLGLSVDEAHYALYATHLALSYFDHPPLVGWVQWPLVVLQAPDAVLRLIPGGLWLGTVLLARQVAQALQPPNPPALLQSQTVDASSKGMLGLQSLPGMDSGAWTVVVLLLAPLLHVLGIGLLPDTLLMFFTVALMRCTLVLMRSPYPVHGTRAQHRTLGAYALLGVLLGLAGLSKYTAVFAALAVALCILRAQGVGVLGTWGPWLALALALALASPVAVWNAQNHWISFVYQAQHGAGNAWEGLHVLRFALMQLLAYGPLLWWGFAGVRRVAAPQRVLVSFFAIAFVVLCLLAGGGTSLPHWTAPAWVALAPFAGIALAQDWAQGRRRLVVAVLALAQALASVALLAMLATGGMPFWAGRAASAEASDPPNPFADVHGWDVAGAKARALAQAHGLSSVSVQNWTLASRIGWYARPLPVHVLQDRFDQFDLWAGKLAVGGSTLLVDWSQQPYVTPLGAHGFQACRWLERVDVQRLGYALAHFDFYACSGWSGHPNPQLKPAVPQPTPAATGP